MKLTSKLKNVRYIGNNFNTWFGDMDFPEIDQMEPLLSQKLPRAMNDVEILKELQPEKVTLAEVYKTMETLDHDTWALFYVDDKDGVLRAVNVSWLGDGWYWNADATSDPYEWYGGSRVFSRKFNSEPLNQTLSPSDTDDSLTLESAIERVKKEGYKIFKEI